MFLFGSGKPDRKLAQHVGHQDDYERIQNDWMIACQNDNILLPRRAVAEFKKRLQRTVNNDEKSKKAKLDFSKCGLDERTVIHLCEILKVKPVIAKLDLSGNYIPDEAAVCIVLLLIQQAKQVRETPPEERSNAVYIQDISLEKNKAYVAEHILSDIFTITGALAHVNVKTLYQKSLLRNDPLNKDSVQKIWFEVTGEKMDKTLLSNYIASRDEGGNLSSEALEILLINDLVSNKVLLSLNQSQQQLIYYKAPVEKSRLSLSKVPNASLNLNLEQLKKYAEIDDEKDAATSYNSNEDEKFRGGESYGTPKSDRSSRSVCSNESRRPSKMGKKSKVNVEEKLDLSEGRSGVGLTTIKDIFLPTPDRSPEKAAIEARRGLDSLLSSQDDVADGPIDLAKMRLSTTPPLHPVSSEKSAMNNSSNSIDDAVNDANLKGYFTPLQGSDLSPLPQGVSPQRDSNSPGVGSSPPPRGESPSEGLLRPPSFRTGWGQGPQNEGIISAITDSSAEKNTSRRNSLNRTLPVWPQPRTASQNGSRRSSFNASPTPSSGDLPRTMSGADLALGAEKPARNEVIFQPHELARLAALFPDLAKPANTDAQAVTAKATAAVSTDVMEVVVPITSVTPVVPSASVAAPVASSETTGAPAVASSGVAVAVPAVSAGAVGVPVAALGAVGISAAAVSSLTGSLTVPANTAAVPASVSGPIPSIVGGAVFVPAGVAPVAVPVQAVTPLMSKVESGVGAIVAVEEKVNEPGEQASDKDTLQVATVLTETVAGGVTSVGKAAELKSPKQKKTPKAGKKEQEDESSSVASSDFGSEIFADIGFKDTESGISTGDVAVVPKKIDGANVVKAAPTIVTPTTDHTVSQTGVEHGEEPCLGTVLPSPDRFRSALMVSTAQATFYDDSTTQGPLIPGSTLGLDPDAGRDHESDSSNFASSMHSPSASSSLPVGMIPTPQRAHQEYDWNLPGDCISTLHSNNSPANKEYGGHDHCYDLDEGDSDVPAASRRHPEPEQLSIFQSDHANSSENEVEGSLDCSEVESEVLHLKEMQHTMQSPSGLQPVVKPVEQPCTPPAESKTIFSQTTNKLSPPDRTSPPSRPLSTRIPVFDGKSWKVPVASGGSPKPDRDVSPPRQPFAYAIPVLKKTVIDTPPLPVKAPVTYKLPSRPTSATTAENHSSPNKDEATELSNAITTLTKTADRHIPFPVIATNSPEREVVAVATDLSKEGSSNDGRVFIPYEEVDEPRKLSTFGLQQSIKAPLPTGIQYTQGFTMEFNQDVGFESQDGVSDATTLAKAGSDAVTGTDASTLAKNEPATLSKTGTDAVSTVKTGADAATVVKAASDAATPSKTGGDAVKAASDAATLVKTGSDATTPSKTGGDAVKAASDAATLVKTGSDAATPSKTGGDAVKAASDAVTVVKTCSDSTTPSNTGGDAVKAASDAVTAVKTGSDATTPSKTVGDAVKAASDAVTLVKTGSDAATPSKTGGDAVKAASDAVTAVKTGSDAATPSNTGGDAVKAASDAVTLVKTGSDATTPSKTGNDVVKAASDAVTLVKTGSDAAKVMTAGGDTVTEVKAGGDAATLSEFGTGAVRTGADAATVVKAASDAATPSKTGGDAVKAASDAATLVKTGGDAAAPSKTGGDAVKAASDTVTVVKTGGDAVKAASDAVTLVKTGSDAATPSKTGGDAVKAASDAATLVKTAGNAATLSKAVGDVATLAKTSSDAVTAPKVDVTSSSGLLLLNIDPSQFTTYENSSTKSPLSPASTTAPGIPPAIKGITLNGRPDMIPNPLNSDILKPPTPIAHNWSSGLNVDDTPFETRGGTSSSSSEIPQDSLGSSLTSTIAQSRSATVSTTAAIGAPSSTVSANSLPQQPSMDNLPFRIPSRDIPQKSSLLESLLLDTPLATSAGVPGANSQNSRSIYGQETEKDPLTLTFLHSSRGRDDDAPNVLHDTLMQHPEVDDMEESDRSFRLIEAHAPRLPVIIQNVRGDVSPAYPDSPGSSSTGERSASKILISRTPNRSILIPEPHLDHSVVKSSPAPTESDLDYAGYDRGRKQEEQEEVEESTPYFADDNPMSVIPPCVEFGGDLGEKLRGEQGMDLSHLEGDIVEYEENAKERSFAFSDDEDDSEDSDDGILDKSRDEDETRRAAKFGRRLSKDGLFQRTHKKGEHLRTPVAESPAVGDLDEEVFSLPLTPPRPSYLVSSVNTSTDKRLRTSTEQRKATENAAALEFPSDSPQSFSDTNPLLRQHSSDSENPLTEAEQYDSVSLQITPRGILKPQRCSSVVSTSTRSTSNPKNQRSQSMTSAPQGSAKKSTASNSDSKVAQKVPWVKSPPKNAGPNSHLISAACAGKEKMVLRDRLRAITTEGNSPSPKKRNQSLLSPSPSTQGKSVPRVRAVRDPMSPSPTILKTDEEWREQEECPVQWLTVLDLTESGIETFHPSMNSIYPRHNFDFLRVLVLRDNLISDLMAMQLISLRSLTDLDMAFNRITGCVPRGVFPPSLERLDLTGNDITDITYLNHCPYLLVLNVSNNCIKDISVYPPNLTELDISDNLIANVIDLRTLSLSSSIKVLRLAGNPVTVTSSQCKVTVCSVLPRLVMLDETVIPSRNARLQNGTASMQSTKDRNTLALMNKSAQERADVARTRSHLLKLRAVEQEREMINREIDERAKVTVERLRARELAKRCNESDTESRAYSDTRSRTSSRRQSYEGRAIRKESFSVFGLTRFPTYSRRSDIRGYQTMHVYSLPSKSNASPTAIANKKLYKGAVATVNKWLLDSIQELGRASMVLGLAFWMTEQPSLGLESQRSFSQAMDGIPFVRSAESAVNNNVRRASAYDRNAEEEGGSFYRVDTALGDMANAVSMGEGDSDVMSTLETAVDNAKDNMLAFTAVLIEVEEAIRRANQPDNANLNAVQGLRRDIEDIMYTPRGQLLNEHVLTPFGCELVWETMRGNMQSDSSPSETRYLRSPPSPWQPNLNFKDSPLRVKTYPGRQTVSGPTSPSNEFRGVKEPVNLALTLDKISTEARDALQDGEESSHSEGFPSYNPSPRGSATPGTYSESGVSDGI